MNAKIDTREAVAANVGLKPEDRVFIFDTTMRDGEQSPGASMTRDEKLRIARQLERLRVDVIEAGFAASSNGDFEAVKAIAAAIKDSTVCSLARANDRDISRAAEALAQATGTNARLLTLSGKRNPYPGKLGVVEPGAYADLLLVDGDPLANLDLVADPAKNFVLIMKDGRIHKNLPRP